MTTYSVRCRVNACRHRRVTKTHPDAYKRVYKCPMCGSKNGWRIESRAYNRRDICGCGQVPYGYPHRKGKHPLCDHHPQGAYNQAKLRGVADEDIPLEFTTGREMKKDDVCPF